MYKLVQDNDCHWFLINAEDYDDFYNYVDACEMGEEWLGHDYYNNRINSPKDILIESFYKA